ncbi:hypothetical protein Tco_0341906, partial [Tanacetum coccineum]
MAVRTQPTLSPGMSSRIAEAAAFTEEVPGTSELILDTDSEGDELGEEDTEEDECLDADDEREGQDLDDEGQDLDDEGQGLDDEGQGLENEGPGMVEEDEAAPKGQQQAVLVVDTAVSEPLGLGYEAARHRALESIE